MLARSSASFRHPPPPSYPIVPTLCVGMPLVTLCVTLWDAERPGLHSHAERGNDQRAVFNNRGRSA
ncbi:hypothetical protein DBV33_03495 [Pseudomonas fluorescens]|nr:hypothetical protein DBV33_03495 [Pseudomonas fluorescens]